MIFFLYKILYKKNAKKKGGNSNKKILLISISTLPSNYEIINPELVMGRSIRSLGIITSALSGLSRFIGTKQDWTGVENILDTVRDEAISHMIQKNNKWLWCNFGVSVELSEIASGQSNALLVCTVSGTMCKKL